MDPTHTAIFLLPKLARHQKAIPETENQELELRKE